MSLQATGLISGLDVNTIIEDLVQAESAPRRRLEDRQKVLSAQQEIVRNLNSNLLILQSRATGLADRTETLQKTVNSSDESVITATATTAAARQTYNLEVSQLATASRVASEDEVSKPADFSRIVRIRLTDNSNSGTNAFQDRIGDRGSFTIDGITQNANLSDAVVTLRNGTVNPQAGSSSQIVIHPIQRSVQDNIAADGSTVITLAIGAGGLGVSPGNFRINNQLITINPGDTVGNVINRINGFTATTKVTASLERDGPVILRSNTGIGTVVGTSVVVTNSVSSGGLGVTAGTFTINGGAGPVAIAVNLGDELGAVINRINASAANVTASVAEGRLLIASNGRVITDNVVMANGTSNFPTMMNSTQDPNAVRLQLKSSDIAGTTVGTVPPVVGKNATPITLRAGTSNFVEQVNFAAATLDGVASAISAVTPSDDTTNTYATRYVSTYDAYDERQLAIPKQLSITKRVTKRMDALTDQTRAIVGRSISFSETDANFISVTQLAAGTQTLISVSPNLMIDGRIANPLQANTPVGKIGDTDVSPTSDDGIILGKFSINGIQFAVPALSESRVNHLSNLNGLALTDTLGSRGITTGTVTINGTVLTVNAVNTIQQAINTVNSRSGATGVTAAFERGQIKLTSANTMTLGASDTSNFLSVVDFALLNNSTIASSQATKQSNLSGLTSVAALASGGITNGTFQINGETFTIAAGETFAQLIDDINTTSITGVRASMTGSKLNLIGPATPILTAGTSNFVARMNFADLPSRGLDITPGTININNVLITISSGDTIRDVLHNINKNAALIGLPDGSTRFGPGVTAILTSDGRIRLTSKEDTPISAADVTSNFISQMGLAEKEATLQDLMDQINASATGVTAVLADTVRSTRTDLTGDTRLTLKTSAAPRSITINGQTFETSAATGIDTVQKLMDAINKNESVGVIAMLTRDAGTDDRGNNRSQLQLVSQNGQDITIANDTLRRDDTRVSLGFNDANSENAFQLKILNTSMTLGGEDDTSNFFEKMGLSEILVMLHSGNLNFGSADTSLTHPKATIRSGVRGIYPSQTIASIKSDIIRGSFEVNGIQVNITDPTTQTLGNIVSQINTNVPNAVAQINSRGQFEITIDTSDLVTVSGGVVDDTLTIGNDRADPRGPNFNSDDP